MKTLTHSLSFLALALLPLSALAGSVNWQDLEVGDAVVLQQGIELVAKDGSPATLKKGESMAMTDVRMLDGISVMLLKFHRADCGDEGLETEMELVLPKEAHGKSEVGVQLAPECMLEVFVETKDFGTIGFFAR